MCTNSPAEGRSGGGLFDAQHRLVGLCTDAVSDQSAGLYVAQKTIGTFLANFTYEADNKHLLVPVTLHDGLASPGLIIVAAGRPRKETPDGSRPDSTAGRPGAEADRLIEKMDNMRGEVRTDLPERPSAIPRR